MATNLHIDDKLLAEARKIGGQKTKRETVTAALKEYIQHRKQLRFLDLMGTLEDSDFWDPPQPPSERNGSRRQRA